MIAPNKIKVKIGDEEFDYVLYKFLNELKKAVQPFNQYDGCSAYVLDETQTIHIKSEDLAHLFYILRKIP